MPQEFISPAVYIAFSLISFLYSSVGHGGATGYLAVLSLLNLPPVEISTTALILNVMTASISLFFYARAGHLKMRLTMPFVIVSIPFAYLGATIPLSENAYDMLLAIVLFATAVRLFVDSIRAKADDAELRKLRLAPAGMVAAVLGLVSGMVGIGGGVFLSPVILLLRWAGAKETSATAACFIVANSLAGLAGRYFTDKLAVGSLAPFIAFAFVGAVAGSYLGARRYSSNVIRRALAAVLIVAVVKLIVSA